VFSYHLSEFVWYSGTLLSAVDQSTGRLALALCQFLILGLKKNGRLAR
jgi:hypothetical protein